MCFEIKNLKELHLDKIGLKKLINLTNEAELLEHLRISDNSLTELPAWIFACRYLKKLDASNNKISLIPPSIGQLKNSLETLRLKDNKISALPAELFSLECLKTLTLDSNNIGKLSSKI